MPLYCYRCDICGAEFERLCQNDQDRREVMYDPCPECGKLGSTQPKLTAHGTYHIRGNNSASTRPRRG